MRYLGRGGMGEVYEAEHIALQRPVALKILLPNLVTEQHVSWFLEEARVASRIEHPNVVVIHDVGEQDGFHYIVMQFISGRDLSALMEDYGGPIPWPKAVRLIHMASKGLHAVHAAGLIHRDIKPANIMLSSDSRVVVMDFGLARKEQGGGLTKTGGLVGTLAFMSPEQCREESLDRRSDIFALGSTLYFLLSGELPFPGTFHEILKNISSGTTPKPLHECNRDIPREVSDLVQRAMAPRPEDHFSNASVLAGELKKQLREFGKAGTATWETQPVAAAALETQVGQELVQMELLPLETGWESAQSKLPWVGVVAAVLLLFAIAVWQNPNEPVPRVRDGQVYIEAGAVHLGNDVSKLREFFSTRLSEKLIESALEAHQQETVRQVDVPAFWIDQYEVTNSQYAAFIRETGREPPEYWEGTSPPREKEDHPVVEVTYEDAEAYCRWAGKELPTREQWVRAFRGDQDQLCPWGDIYEAGRANVGDVGDDRKYLSTSPINDTPRDVSPFKVYNMMGNASEFIRGDFLHKGRTWRVGKGAEFRTEGFLKGISSWHYLYPDGFKDKGLGFRCVSEEP